jgi:hypothetical protein
MCALLGVNRLPSSRDELVEFGRLDLPCAARPGQPDLHPRQLAARHPLLQRLLAHAEPLGRLVDGQQRPVIAGGEEDRRDLLGDLVGHAPHVHVVRRGHQPASS